jgi:hypothetical protein
MIRRGSTVDHPEAGRVKAPWGPNTDEQAFASYGFRLITSDRAEPRHREAEPK